MANIKQVAREAGVSISTVSNVLTGARSVSPELCARVTEAVSRLHYHVDPVASSLKSRRTMTLGFLVTAMDSVFFPQVIGGIQRQAEAAGYSLMFYPTNRDPAREKKHLRQLLYGRVDGILVDSVVPEDDGAYFSGLGSLRFGEKPVPVVSLERDLTAHGVDSVLIDHCRGGRMATEHLAAMGCRRIAHITGPLSAPWSGQRLEGYRRALAEAGLPIREERILQGDFTPLSGYRQTLALLDAGEDFDGLFAANDLMAVGAVKALRERGLQVPGQVRVIGFDDIFVSSIASPSFSTIHVPKTRLGEEAARMLLSRIEAGGVGPARTVELPIRLIERQSTNPLQGGEWELT